MDNFHKCKYCGEKATYYFPTVKSWCCSSSHNKCPANKKKNKDKHIGKERPIWLANMLRNFNKNKIISNKTREKLRLIGYNRKHTDETKIKIGKSNKGKLLGCKRNDEFKQKISSVTKMENNPNWKGGVSFLPYSLEFNNELKNKIKIRDNFECKNPDCKQKTNIITIHHIDYNKYNCSELNLITLCSSCNSRANGNREKNRSKYMVIIEKIYNSIQ